MQITACGCMPHGELGTMKAACIKEGPWGIRGRLLHRYMLMRSWDAKPALGVVMFNPSIADATIDDPTIRRVVGSAKKHGYGGIVVMNAFSLISTDPKAVIDAPRTAVGPECDAHLARLREFCDDVVLGWGAPMVNPRMKIRLGELRALIGPAKCWGVTKYGAPRHPLYLPANTPLRNFEWDGHAWC